MKKCTRKTCLLASYMFLSTGISGIYFSIYYIKYATLRATLTSTSTYQRGTISYQSLDSDLHQRGPNDPLPSINVNTFSRGLTCSKLMVRSNTLRSQANDIHALNYVNRSNIITPREYIIKSRLCADFIKSRQYIMTSLTEEERDFSIAFSILMYRDVEQVERLLRAIYRPQNFYCIHVDESSKEDIHAAMKAIASCFDNVFIAATQIDVRWGRPSVLAAEMSCVRELWKYSTWKYFINLTGQEFPLKTNYELVQILKALQGTNIISGSFKHRDSTRTKYVWRGRRSTRQLKSPPPGNISLTKGSTHIVAQRGYVDFILHNETAINFFAWLHDTWAPDETFFSSLNFNPQLGVPGSSRLNPDVVYLNRTENIQRYKLWHRRCHGKRIRHVCIFGVGDLEAMIRSPALFANKFFYNYAPLALDCLEEWFWNKTRNYMQENRVFDASQYRSLRFVQNSFVPNRQTYVLLN